MQNYTSLQAALKAPSGIRYDWARRYAFFSANVAAEQGFERLGEALKLCHDMLWQGDIYHRGGVYTDLATAREAAACALEELEACEDSAIKSGEEPFYWQLKKAVRRWEEG